MPVLAGPALVAAALIVLAGAQKLVEPTMAVGALRSLRLPGSPMLVRAGSCGEMVIGLMAIVDGGPLWWGLVALSYGAFALFVLAALRAGTMIGSCGCFGREETPPHFLHVGIDVVLAGIAAAMAARSGPELMTALVDEPGAAVPLVSLSAISIFLLYAAFVYLPRALRPAG